MKENSAFPYVEKLNDRPLSNMKQPRTSWLRSKWSRGWGLAGAGPAGAGPAGAGPAGAGPAGAAGAGGAGVAGARPTLSPPSPTGDPTFGSTEESTATVRTGSAGVGQTTAVLDGGAPTTGV